MVKDWKNDDQQTKEWRWIKERKLNELTPSCLIVAHIKLEYGDRPASVKWNWNEWWFP